MLYERGNLANFYLTSFDAKKPLFISYAWVVEKLNLFILSSFCSKNPINISYIFIDFISFKKLRLPFFDTKNDPDIFKCGIHLFFPN